MDTLDFNPRAFDPTAPDIRFAPFDPARLVPPEPLLLADLLPGVGVALLAAPPKSGKTDLATAVAYALATGADFAGRPTAGGEDARPVLWANYEENAAERVALLGRLPAAAPNLWLSSFLPALDTKEGLDALKTFCDDHNPRLIVLDSLHAAVERTDIARPTAARRLLRRLAELARHRRLCVLVLHHTDRSGRRCAESVQVEAGAGVVLLMSAAPCPRDPAARLVTLTATGRGIGLGRRTRLVSEAPLHYRLAIEDDLAPAAAPERPAPDPLDDRIVAALGDARGTAREIAFRLRTPHETVRKAVRRLENSARIRVAELRGATLVYAPALKPPEPIVEPEAA